MLIARSVGLELRLAGSFEVLVRLTTASGNLGVLVPTRGG